MSDSNSAYRIKQLEDARGYSAWATKMIDVLTDQDLDDYVIGSKTAEPTVGENASAQAVAAHAEWKKKQRKALSAIRLRVGDGPMAYIQMATTAVDARTKLARVYQPKGAISIIRLRRQLFRAACVEGEDVEQHIRNLTQIRSTLEGFGSIIDET